MSWNFRKLAPKATRYTRVLNVISVLLLMTSVFLWIALPGMAQEEAVTTESDSMTTDSESEDETSDDNTECLEEIALPVMEAYNDVTTFLGQHYQSEDPASGLLETALLKFKQYETTMHELLLEYGVSEELQTIAQEGSEAKKCLDFVEIKIRQVEQILRNHHVQNASAKTTYTLVQKLKTLNDGLRDMATDFAEIYAQFKSLDSKLANTTEGK